MRSRQSLKRNRFTYVYDKVSNDLDVYYNNNRIDTVPNVTPRHVESTFRTFVEDYIKDCKNGCV